MEFSEACRILAAFEREGVRYVLIGSMAMAAQGLIRATRDMDFFVAPAPDNVERLKIALRGAFDNDPNIEDISADDLGGDYPALYRMKKDTVRPQDRVDAAALRERFGLEEE